MPSYYQVIVITVISTLYVHGEHDCKIKWYQKKPYFNYCGHIIRTDIFYILLSLATLNMSVNDRDQIG